MTSKSYYVYIMTNKSHSVLYTGVTNDINRRVYQHKMGIGGHFTRKYKVNQLVYCESCSDVIAAITREKQIKAGSRQNKVDLINRMNPDWKDLSEEF